MTFNSKGRIYDMNDKFWSHLTIISLNWFWSIQPHCKDSSTLYSKLGGKRLTAFTVVFWLSWLGFTPRKSSHTHIDNLKLFTHLVCQPLINKGIPSGADVNKKFQMQTKRVTDDSAICQQRLSSPNIKQILNKRNKKNIKWHFRLHNVFYKV